MTITGSPAQRLATATAVRQRLTAVIDAIDAGELTATHGEYARLQGAVTALGTITGQQADGQ